MKKKIIAFMLAAIMGFSICSCGKSEQEKSGQNVSKESESSQMTETETGFSYADFTNLEFSFCSGAGGWATYMTIDADGSFYGEFFDGELGSTGDGYPNGTMYRADFHGQFTEPVKVNEYTYAMQIQEINYEEELGKEEIKDGVLYCYTTAYGLDEAEDILIYLPGAPLAELPEEFRSWVGYYDLSNTIDTELPFYALNNEVMQYGFSSYDIVETLKESISYTESWAISLENSIQNDSLTQTEYNEKTQQLYEMWDYQLNELWGVLKRILDEETMKILTIEEREWIAKKEQAVAEAGTEYEDGSIKPMIMNLKAAEMTKDRVYELLELLE